jgi:ketosteroid isomerase-like protein
MIGTFLLRAGVTQAFAALRRKDLAGVMKGWADGGVYEFPGHSAVSGRFEGKDAISARWERVFARLETFDIRAVHIAVARPYAFGPRNTGLVEWVADETAYDGTRIHLEGAAVLEIRGRHVVHARDYIFDLSPLEVMWGPPASTATTV